MLGACQCELDGEGGRGENGVVGGGDQRVAGANKKPGVRVVMLCDPRGRTFVHLMWKFQMVT